MLGHARRTLPAGTLLCVLQRERVDTSGASGSEPFPAPPCLAWAPASTPWPAGVSPVTGRGQLEWGWVGGSCFALWLRSPCPAGAAITASSVPCSSPGGPTDPGWQLPVGWPQALGRLPAPLGPSCAPAGGSCHSSPPAGVPPGSLQWHWPVPRSPGPFKPPCLFLVVALPCPSSFPESGDQSRDRGRNWGTWLCCGPSPGSGGAGKGRTVWLSQADSPGCLPGRALAQLQVSCGR